MILPTRNDLDEATEVANEACQLAEQHGPAALASQLKRIVDGMRKRSSLVLATRAIIRLRCL